MSVTAAKGFLAAGVTAGLKASGRPDLALVVNSGPDAHAVDAAVAAIRRARRPLIVAGGGVINTLAEATLVKFAETRGIPVTETQAGKGVLAWDHPCNAGAIGVTGSPALANRSRISGLLNARVVSALNRSTIARGGFAGAR